jgi:hypothetical protein
MLVKPFRGSETILLVEDEAPISKNHRLGAEASRLPGAGSLKRRGGLAPGAGKSGEDRPIGPEWRYKMSYHLGAFFCKKLDLNFPQPSYRAVPEAD